MKILLVEDDGYKQTRIEKVLKETVRTLELTIVKSVREAVHVLQGSVFDHIVLDIALPSHDNLPGGGGALPMPSGGIEVLLELSYQGRSDLVTILTQYPEIELDGILVGLKVAKRAIMTAIKSNIVDVIHFEMDNNDWKPLLAKTVNLDA